MTTYRVPPSLNWLLDNRRRIAGQIQKIEGKIAKFAEKYTRAKIIVDQHDLHLPRVLRSLKADLQALDQTIGLHQLTIDLESVAPIREQVRRPRYGNMTPTIYACFALGPKEWKTTNEIAVFVTTRRYPGIRDYEFPEYRDAVHRRLEALHKRGWVEKFSAIGLRQESLWRRISQVATSSKAPSDDDSLGSSHGTSATVPPER